MATVCRQSPARMGLTQLLNLLRLMGEAAWLYPWSLAVGMWFGGAPRPLLEVPALLAVLLLAAAGAQAAVRAHGHPGLAKGAFIALGAFIACLVALGQLPHLSHEGGWIGVWELLSRGGYGGRAATGAAVVVLLWWRGILVGRSRPDSGNIEAEFRTGIFAMVGLLVVAALAGENANASSSTLLLAVIALVCSGLVGMPLARVVDESDRDRRPDSPRLSPGGPWLTMLLGIVGAVLLVTLLLAQIFTFQRLDLLLEPLRGPLDAMLWVLIYVVALPMGFLVAGVIYIIGLLLKPGGAPDPFQAPDTGWLDELHRQSQAGPAAPELLLVLKVGLAALLGLAVVAILAQAVRRISHRWDDEEVEEVRGFLSSRPGLRDLLQWLLRRLRPARPRTPGRHTTQTAPAGAAEGVRELYREFLTLGAALGRGRKPPETPREYQARLEEDGALLGAGEVDLITESYNRARYAPSASEPPDAGPVAAAMARLRALWQNLSPS